MWNSSGILELTTSGAPQEPEQSSGTTGSDAPHLSSGRHESIPQCWRSPHGIVWQIDLQEGRWRFGWTNVGLSQIETRREESVATAEEDAPLEMQEAVAEKLDMAEDFDVDENPPDEPVTENMIELLEDISGGQSADEPDVQLEIDVECRQGTRC
jgi:hypothetical protein